MGSDIAMIVLGLAAIAGIYSLEKQALKMGINGRQLRLSVALIAGIGGMCMSTALHLLFG